MTAHQEYRENLPLLAVGALTAEETVLLERHLAGCDECREELRALTEAAAQIALAVEPAVPSASSRDRLVAQLNREQPIPSDGSRVSRTAPAPSPAGKAWFWIPAFASLILAFSLAALWTQNRKLATANQQLASRLSDSEVAAQHARELIDTLTAGDAVQVNLVAGATKPQPQAKAVYSSRQRNLVLLASNLNPLPAHKAYELWLLPTNSSPPLPAGTFKPDSRGSATLVLSQFGGGVSAKGFAVTIEDESGAATPTMPIVLSGTT